MSLAYRIDAVRPSVVRVATALGSGTGFFINSDGYVITAGHVVTGPDGTVVQTATIQLPYENVHAGNGGLNINYNVNGTFHRLPAVVLDIDRIHDIAILKPTKNPLSPGFRVPSFVGGPGIPDVKLMPRSAAVLEPRRLKDGEPIFISGYPLSIAVLITTSGAIASSDAVDIENNTLKDVYWGDIRANHGNSGGPVVSLETNKVIGMQRGIATANAEFEGGSYAYGFGVDNQGNVVKDAKGNSLLRPILYNSGLTEIIPAEFIVALLTKNHISF